MKKRIRANFLKQAPKGRVRRIEAKQSKPLAKANEGSMQADRLMGQGSASAQEEKMDRLPASVVEFPQQAIKPAEQGVHAMTLTYKGLNKKGTQAIYSGGRASIRFSLAAFEGKVAPDTIEVSGLAAPTLKKVKLTAEEQKAARAAQPKPTLAERAERARIRADKLAAAVAAAEAQPSM